MHDTLVENCKNYALVAHTQAHNTYYGTPYSTHLWIMHNAMKNFIDLVPEKHRNTVMAAGWCHDLLHMTKESYPAVKATAGVVVAEIAFAISPLRGRTFDECYSEEYFKILHQTPYAPFVKTVDILADVYYMKHNAANLAGYKKLWPKIKYYLYDKRYAKIFQSVEKCYE